MAIDQEIADLKQTSPFRYLDRIVAGGSGEDSIEGWVELQSSAARLYAASLSGMLLVEALAQLSGVLLRRKTGLAHGGFLSAIETATFAPEPPVEGGVELRARVKHSAFPHFTLETSARQGGRLLCACTLSARIKTGEVH